MEDLVTARLILHPMNADEAARVVAREPGEGDRWAPGYPDDVDVEGARHYLGHCAKTGDPQPFGCYEIRRRADGHAIGGLGFNRPPDVSGVPIGYGLIPSARGNGYASEALRELLRFARSRGITRVRGDADHGNVASQHVMAAVGMRFAGADDTVKYYEITWPDTEAAGATAADTPRSPTRP